VERIEQRFNERFKKWQIRLPPEDIAERRRGMILERGWSIKYLFGRNEKGEYLDVYASHRMTDDTHERVYESGEVEELEAKGFGDSPLEPGGVLINRFLRRGEGKGAEHPGPPSVPAAEPATLRGYVHGPTPCRLCFSRPETILSLGDWRLRNDPGYYGSSRPRILVLGFSKGAHQGRAAAGGEFDRIAFAGMRPRLRAVLETLGLMPSDRGIDHLMSAAETEFGFASLVRCSLCRMKSGRCRTSGDVIASAFRNAETRSIIKRCADTYLGRLPESVKLVVMLGTADGYVAKVTSTFSELHGDFAPVNEVAFRAGGALWVFAAHPSPGNGHFQAWVSGEADEPPARKRVLALRAIERG
jgi:hypothetical protein